jgi:predicted ATPase
MVSSRSRKAKLNAKGAGIWRPYFLFVLGEAYLTADLVDDSFAAATEALDAVAEYDEHQHTARIHCLLDELFLRRDGPEAVEQARAHFKRAIEIARLQSAKMLELQATTSLAKLLARQGLGDQARPLLSGIYEQFTEGFDGAALKQAKALLEELNIN